MYSPRPWLPRCCRLSLVAWLLLPGALPASERVAQALRERLPRYDPAQYVPPEKRTAQAPPAEPGTVASGAPVAVPSPPAAEPLLVEPGVVELKPFRVQERRLPRDPKLPRLTPPLAHRPGLNVNDSFLSPEERQRRVVEKHLSPLDRLLNPVKLFGAGRATDAEARESLAAKLDWLAYMIELARADGATPEEIQMLRRYYLELYAARPKG